MDPKNADRLGKGALFAVVAAIGMAVKKYGPKILAALKDMLTKKSK